MSKTIEISREMFDRMINALEDEGWYNLADEAAKAIAVPVVERQDQIVLSEREESARRIKSLLAEIDRLKNLSGDPVAEITYTGYEPSNSIHWLNKGLHYMEPGTKLYASPPKFDANRNPDAWLVTDIYGQKKALRSGAEGIERHRNAGSTLVPLYADPVQLDDGWYLDDCGNLRYKPEEK
jgi:hypothetical protein